MAEIAEPSDYARFRSDYEAKIATKEEIERKERESAEAYAVHAQEMERKTARAKLVLVKVTERYLTPGTPLQVSLRLTWGVSYPDGPSSTYNLYRTAPGTVTRYVSDPRPGHETEAQLVVVLTDDVVNWTITEEDLRRDWQQPHWGGNNPAAFELQKGTLLIYSMGRGAYWHARGFGVQVDSTLHEEEILAQPAVVAQLRQDIRTKVASPLRHRPLYHSPVGDIISQYVL